MFYCFHMHLFCLVFKKLLTFVLLWKDFLFICLVNLKSQYDCHSLYHYPLLIMIVISSWSHCRQGYLKRPDKCFLVLMVHFSGVNPKTDSEALQTPTSTDGPTFRSNFPIAFPKLILVFKMLSHWWHKTKWPVIFVFPVTTKVKYLLFVFFWLDSTFYWTFCNFKIFYRIKVYILHYKS